MTKKSILLLNIGTPSSLSGRSIRRYLSEFLNDKRVIDLPFILRFILSNFFIIPFRYRQTLRNYRKIWQATGSPLLNHSIALKNDLALVLGDDFQVEIAMRYGEPSIKQALSKFESLHSLFVIPLFPQYSSAATGSAIEKTLSIIQKQWNIPKLHVIRDFYNQEFFIQAYVKHIQNTIDMDSYDMLLLSYHGLPERHISKSNCQAVCNKLEACPVVSIENQFCYRAQCYATSNHIATQLGLSPDKVMVAFQSRLGRIAWIQPYTDQVLSKLITKGIRRLAVACPSFVIDCLETLEEINIRCREQWISLGGEAFEFIPALNNHPLWIEAIKKMIL